MPTHLDKTRRERGFSLIELLIVVGIIGVLAAIAFPNYIESQHAAAASSAVAALRQIHSAEVTYRGANSQYADLAQLGTGEFIQDPALLSGKKSKYQFVVALGADPAAYYQATADPSMFPGHWRHFFVDATGVIRSNLSGPADATSQPIQ